MKKIFYLILFLVPAIAFSEPSKNEKVLINQGIELCSIIKEKAACETYLNFLFSSQEILDLAKNACNGNFKKLESVVRITFDGKSLLEESGISFDEKSLPETLSKDLLDTIYAQFPAILNGKTGSAQLALSSVLTASAVFDADFSFDKYLYVFKFKDAYPICVVYSHGKDKAVRASACILFNKSFLEEMPDYITAESIDF